VEPARLALVGVQRAPPPVQVEARAARHSVRMVFPRVLMLEESAGDLRTVVRVGLSKLPSRVALRAFVPGEAKMVEPPVLLAELAKLAVDTLMAPADEPVLWRCSTNWMIRSTQAGSRHR
jgi:hypothetical protein